MTTVRSPLVLASLALGGCSDEPAADLMSVPPLPVIEASSVHPNRNNVLSAVVAVRAKATDSVTVRYRLATSGALADSATPTVLVTDSEAFVPVLGLLPGERYTARVTAFGPGGEIQGEELTFTTDTLPSDLPRYVAGGPAPSPGYVAFAAGRYGLVIDNTGRVVWYRRFDPIGPGLNFQAQPNGRYVALPATPDSTDVELFVEIDRLGDETRRLGCAGGLRPRFHDLLVESDGGYWIMCDEARIMDLTAVGGQPAARVTGTVVQHINPAGALLFQWSPFDHFSITDLDSASRAGALVNWTHGNSLDLTAEGDLVVSFRSLNEITSISTTTGAVRWRMGGLRNEFTFLDTPMPAFARQHGVRITTDGLLQLLDNLGDPEASRAERYILDPQGRTVRLVGVNAANPAARALLGGTTQELPDGRLLVAYGNGSRVEEYDQSGLVVWRIEGNPGYVFRAQRIRSLYTPGVGMPR
jgi:Arylsulfotransferase (ASST)